MKIQNKILLYFLVPGLLIGSLAVGIGYHSIRKVVEQNIHDQLEVALDKLSTRICLFLDEKKNRLIDFSSDGFIKDCTEKITNGIDVDSCTLNLNKHILYNKKPLDTDILEVFIVDIDGKVINSTEINRIGKDVSGEGYFQKATKIDPFITDLHYSTEFSANTYDVSRLLISKDGEKTVGIIVNRYKDDGLRKVTRSGMPERFGETGESYIVNSDKLMVTESRFIKGAVLKQIVDTEGIRVAFENRTDMTGIYPDYRGIPVLGVTKYFEEMDWVIVAEKDISEAFVSAVRIRNFAIIMGTTGIIVLVIMTVLIAKGITRPIHKLVASANTIAHGNLTEEIIVKSRDEISDLASSLDTMRIKIGISMTDIEDGKREWESTFDSVRDIIILWDKDCGLIRCNKALLDNLDVKSEDIIGKSCHEVFPRIKNEDLSRCAVIETIKTLKPVTNDIEIPCLDGIFEVSNFPRFDANGEFTGAVQIMRNITERKQAEDELRKYRDHLEELIEERTRDVKISEERYRSITEDVLDTSSIGIFILDADFQVVLINRAIERYFGIRREDVVERDKRLLIRERIENIFEDPEGFAGKVLATYDDNTYTEHFECHILPEGGRKERWLEHWSQPVESGIYTGGRIEQYTDITERKRAEVALNEAKQKADVANKSKSEFIANMSHELKTPLNAVIGFSEILLDRSFGEINEKQEKYLNNIHKSGNRLLEMINDIIDLSRADSGRMVLELEGLSLSHILNDTVATLKPAAIKKNIEIKTYIDEKLSTINADDVKLRKIINILLGNAVKFTPDGGMINIEAVKIEDKVRMSVTDTGIGVKPDDQERVLMGLEQSDGSYTRKHGGTGLGLALARRLVKMHGGRIWLESPPKKESALEEGKGSSFIFTIPCNPKRPDAGIIDPTTKLLTWECFFKHIERILRLHKRVNHQFGLLCLKLEAGEKKFDPLSFAEVFKDVIRKYEIFTHDKEKKYYYTALLEIDRVEIYHAAMRISEALKERGYAANIKTVIYPEDGDSVDALCKALSG